MKKTLLIIVLLLTLCIGSVSADEQIDTIVSARDNWAQEVGFGLWNYTVTDLDQNGRLELLSASLQGTGLFTYLHGMEITEDGGIADIRYGEFELNDAPDLITAEPVHCYFDKQANRRIYIFRDWMRNGYAEQYEAIQGFYLENGEFFDIPLAYKATIYTDEENFTVTYEDAEGFAITEEQYEHIEEKYFGALPMETVTFTWLSTTEEEFAALSDEALRDSLESVLTAQTSAVR